MATDELGTVVGLPYQIAQRDATAIEVLLNAGGEDGAGSGGAALGKGPEQQSAAHFARRVLDDGQIEGLGLGPVAGDVVKIFGVGGDLLKDAPGGLDVGEVLFALILARAFFEQAVLAPDAFQGAMAEREIELADETAGAEGKQLLAQSDDLFFDGGGSFAGLVMGSAGKFDQTARSVLLIAAQLLAHGGDGGLKPAGGRLDTSLPSRLHQTQTMIVGVAHFTHQDEVRDRHAGAIVRRGGGERRVVEKWKSRLQKRRGISTFPPPRRRLRAFSPIPYANLQLPTPFCTHALQCHQGDTMWVGSTTLFS
ncbi:MAG TPA: hypothetical protein VGE83_03620 [Terracidiphilus sp.]